MDGWSRPEECSDGWPSEPALFGLLVLDVLYDIANGQELFGIAIGNLDAELLFEGHDEFDDVEGVGPQIFNKLGFGGNTCSALTLSCSTMMSFTFCSIGFSLILILLLCL